jgi:hypothetical protein
MITYYDVKTIINSMLPYQGIKWLLGIGYTINKRKKRSKDILRKQNYICLLSPCKSYRVEYNLSDEDYTKIYFLI